VRRARVLRRVRLLTGADVRRIRERLKLTPEVFAAVVGASTSTVYRWEASTGPIAMHASRRRTLVLLRDDPKAAARLVELGARALVCER
jgi:DNA-binding transcriptional regulator YiaG